jgi:HAD superfamily hydrolase (TIGR01549 family)
MLAQMPSPRAILFDLDDTLTDRSRSIERLAAKLLQRFGDDLENNDLEEICRCIHAGDGGGYASREGLGAHLQSSLRWRRVPTVEQLVAFWRDRFPRCNVERTGVTLTLQTLRGRGLKLGVVSNGSISSQYTKLDVIGIRSLFSVILISDEVGIKKPDPRIFQMALDKLGLLPSEAIFVGDNPALDVAGSRAVGLRGIWLNCRGDPPPKDISCPESITSFEQVVALCGS